MKNLNICAIILAVFAVFPAFSVFCQNNGEDEHFPRQEIFISPVIEINRYSLDSMSLALGLAAGAGDKLAVGIKPLFSFALEGSENEDGKFFFNTLEMGAFLRYYILPSYVNAGLFAQIDFGCAVYILPGEDAPVEFGSVAAGLCAGWRFPIIAGLYAEPYVRFGYPYIFGAGAYVGYRF